MHLLQFLDKNLEALKRTGSPIPAWLAAQDCDPNTLQNQLTVSRFGFVDFKINKDSSLFPGLPPDAFYRDWKPDENAHKGTTVIVGCGLGYGVNTILTGFPQSHRVAVLEPRADMLIAMLGLTDYTPFIESGRLTLLPPDGQALFNYLAASDLQFLFGNVRFRADVASRQIGPEYAQWAVTVKATMENVGMELRTLRSMQDTMVGNEIDNYRPAFRNGSITPMKDSANGLTGIIVGAGPSLAEVGPQLAQAGGNALMATALQTLPALHAVGLKPHMCMAIDYSPGIVSVFDRLDPEWAADIPFFYSTKVRHEVVERYPGPAIPMWTMGGLATFLMQGREHILDVGGNVSVGLLRFFEWCGISRIVLAGQDFAWSGDQSHVSGHHASFKRTFDPDRHVKMQDMHGNEIISAMPYVTAKRDMENDVLRTDTPVFNIYGGGLEIKGAEVVDMDSLQERKLLECDQTAYDRFETALNRAGHPCSIPVFEARADQWANSVRSFKKRLAKLFKKAPTKQEEIRRSLEQLLMFLKQDPLYMPYLYNECMNIANYARLEPRLERRHHAKIKADLDRVLTKVRHMDDALGSEGDTRAA